MVAFEGGTFVGGDCVADFFGAAFPWVAMALLVALVSTFSDVFLRK